MLVDDSAREHQAREIELELVRVRSAAEAARLEARAAELELMLRRIARGVDSSGAVVVRPISPVELQSPIGSAGQESAAPDSWSKRLARLQSRDTTEESRTGEAASAPNPFYSAVELQRGSSLIPPSNESRSRADTTDFWKPTLPLIEEQANGVNEQPIWSRVDVGNSSIPLTHLNDRSSIATDFDEQKNEPEVEKPVDIPKESLKRQATIPIPKIETNSDDPEEQPARKLRPASLLVSTLAHVAVLVFLGLMTLASNPPKDQLAFTSSVSETSEESVETFEIESSEPTEPTEPVSETAYEVSEVGTMAVTEVSLDAPPALAVPSTSDLFSSSSSSLSSSAMKSLKGDSTAKTQFCGVDGGGNHFVYLVDSSGSMRDGFQSARDELLASIDQLKPDQRFYVVFFDDDPAYMRLSDPNVDESASVMATPENKKRLRAWAMTVQMDKGRAPYDILPFALTLRPDVIFLLSDGEFPARIEEILREQNHEENLFGESGPISIVHTIRYHGLEGEVGKDAEATMVKIAKENGGQYRHVPKPKT